MNVIQRYGLSMDRTMNPYSPGSGRKPPEFAGRDGDLEAFDTVRARTAAGSTDRGIIMTGLRGVGKTVLLNEMLRMAEDFDWLTVRLEARPEQGGAAAVRRSLARDLVAAARKYARRPAKSRMKSALATITAFNASVGATGLSLGVTRAAGRADSGNTEIDIAELVEDVSVALAEDRRAFAIFIDEMQDLDAETMAALIAAQHQASQREWPFYVIGAGLPNLPRMLAESRSYAERLFNYRPIGPLSRDDTATALQNPAARLGVEYSTDALEVLLDAADGYPYFIQEYGQSAWNVASSRTIEVSDAQAAVVFGTEQLDAGFFRSRWDRASGAERRLLVAMAADRGEPSRPAAIALRMGVQATAISSLRARLIAKGLIYAPEHGQLAFTVPGMAAFVARHRENVEP